MKKLYALLPLLLASYSAHSQCSFVEISVSSSDTTYVQLYHPGFFNLPSGFANVCVWEVTTFSNTIVHQDTTSGAWADQSFSLFNHSVPITDSMRVTLVITNDTTGTTCTITDTLFWEETEVIPGVFIGNWAILGSNGGVATGLADATATRAATLTVFPSPALDHVRITGVEGPFDLAIVDARGALVATHRNVSPAERVDVSRLLPGVYIIRLTDDRELPLGLARVVKQ